ncbi:hypothetical protein [Streptomyces sp. NPDC059176]|uniref:hypothetical protein n=1 Tax=unclassified Streptomyces TaxID=2593676 RepID=UPI0036A17427
MRRGALRVGAVLIGVTTALLGSNTAVGSAFYVYQGDDFGYITYNHKAAGACDREADGFNVYTNFKRTYPNRVVRVEEKDGFCRSSTTGTYSVYTIQACENRPFMPDACSGWAEHR